MNYLSIMILLKMKKSQCLLQGAVMVLEQIRIDWASMGGMWWAAKQASLEDILHECPPGCQAWYRL